MAHIEIDAVNDESIEFEEIEGELELVPPEIYASNLIAWAVERMPVTYSSRT